MKRIKFKKYAGFKINGTVAQQPVNFESSHLDRAAWITAEVESGGKYGTVMNYDGTGMTAGIHQAIAVYPRYLQDDRITNDQGPLWKLLNRMRTAAPECLQLINLFEKMFDTGWYLDDSGVLRYLKENGEIVDGKTIRAHFTGAPNGCAPTRGKARSQAELWVQMFHEAFKHKDTFGAQDAYGKEHFVKRALRTKLRFCNSSSHKKRTIHDALYGPEGHITDPEMVPFDTRRMDLAASVFWSNTVNAPGAALKVLCKTINEKGFPGYHSPHIPPEGFARYLLHDLGTSSYGRWDDDIKGGRYQRTRKAAMDIWSKKFFDGADAIMPKDLEG
jgi:hypothetical protein